MEFMAIIWLRESSPDEGRIRVPFHSDASGRESRVAADSRALRHEESHLQRMQHEQRQRGGHVYTGAGAGAGAEAVARSGDSILQARAGAGSDPPRDVEYLSGSDRSKEVAHEDPLMPLHPQLQQPRPQPLAHQAQPSQQVEPLRQEEQLQQLQQQRLQPTEQDSVPSIPSSSTKVGSIAATPELSTASETIARGVTSTFDQPNQEPSTFTKNAMNDNTQKAKTGTGKHRSSRGHDKNQRGGFKSTKERKLAQLIPALDENGVVIEDHFISPRDTDGDGIPDIYVLLRPTANSRYMMDVGLFDEDSVLPPPVLPVPPLSPATPITPAPFAPSTTAELSVPLASEAPIPIPVLEIPVPAAPPAPAVPFIESPPAPEPPASAALLSVIVEGATPEVNETSAEPAAVPVVALAEARLSTQ
ncbi:hypothetical protein EC968_002862 [Mortierella alpina]|nr:hypothetical protein EC968_002862 [Mortierella alpina]